jgi:hypothetical protein
MKIGEPEEVAGLEGDHDLVRRSTLPVVVG